MLGKTTAMPSGGDCGNGKKKEKSAGSHPPDGAPYVTTWLTSEAFQNIFHFLS